MTHSTSANGQSAWGLDWKSGVIAAALLVAAQAAILHLMGRIWICKCGTVKFWHGVVVSSENSQHLADWYTFSHVIHGFLFYFLFWLLFRRSHGLDAAVLCDPARSRRGKSSRTARSSSTATARRRSRSTISATAIINSVSDTLWMVLGFFLAARLPVWLTIVLAIAVRARRRLADPRQPHAQRADADLPDRGGEDLAGRRLSRPMARALVRRPAPHT